MTIILSVKSKTSRAISEEGGIPLYTENPLPEQVDILVRWGSRKPTNTIAKRELNPIDAIARASDKVVSRQILTEKRVPVPVSSETLFPVVGRTRQHKAGSGFFYCTNEQEVQIAKIRGAVYFSQFYPKQNEYRVHVAGGRVLLFSVKEGDKTQKIWNKRKSNFKFRHMHRHEWLESENLMHVQRIAKKAVRALGLDFGAVDVMADAGEGFAPAVVTEVNTTPALSPLAVRKYLKYFAEVEAELNE